MTDEVAMTVKPITAGDAYRDRRDELLAILDLLRERLAAHARHAAAQPEWSLVEDLAQARGQLVELAVRLTALPPTVDEEEARALIELRLSALPNRQRRSASGISGASSCVTIPGDEGD